MGWIEFPFIVLESLIIVDYMNGKSLQYKSLDYIAAVLILALIFRIILYALKWYIMSHTWRHQIVMLDRYNHFRPDVPVLLEQVQSSL